MFKELFVAAAATTALFAGSQADAKAEYQFTVCGSGYSGVATSVTSCAFADSARSTWYAEGGPGYMVAYSPTTGLTYGMNCQADQIITLAYQGQRLGVLCQGGHGAAVVFW